MSVDHHPHLHGAGDAALWAGVLGGTALGGSWMLGGLGGKGDEAGEYGSTGGGFDVTVPESGAVGVGGGEAASDVTELKDERSISPWKHAEIEYDPSIDED